MRSDSCGLYDASILSALWSAAAAPTDVCCECDEATELADVDIERVDWGGNDNTHARASVNKTGAQLATAACRITGGGDASNSSSETQGLIPAD